MACLYPFCASTTARPLRCVLLVFAVLLSPGAGLAAEYSCPASSDGAPPTELALAERVCRVLERFDQQLADCSLGPLNGITFRIVKSLPAERGDPLATYDASSDLILLMPPGAVEQALTARSAYRGVPPAALYDSLIVHELAHAYVARVVPRNAQYPMAQEYVSYVFQFDSMPAPVRRLLLERLPQAGPVQMNELNLFVAQAAPLRFGVKAWRHFTQPDGGCGTLQRVLRGDAIFPQAN